MKINKKSCFVKLVVGMSWTRYILRKFATKTCCLKDSKSTTHPNSWQYPFRKLPWKDLGIKEWTNSIKSFWPQGLQYDQRNSFSAFWPQGNKLICLMLLSWFRMFPRWFTLRSLIEEEAWMFGLSQKMLSHLAWPIVANQ
mgnify:CR=1 FL=1